MSAKNKRKKHALQNGPTGENLLRGVFSGNINGYGFAAREDGVTPDVFIPADRTGGAITGDIVEFRLVPGGARGPVGHVVSIVSRTVKELTGVLLSQNFLQALDSRFPGKIKLKGSLRGGKKGDWLRVRLLAEGTDINDAGKKKRSRRAGRDETSAFPVLAGEVTEKIGRVGTVPSDLAAVASEYGIAEPYSEAENQAALRIRPREIASRRDLTKLFAVTIDPGDAKDFDDALSVESGKRRGEVLVGVHIADVASWIRPGSRFAQGAARRGFSSYMPGLFRPMLPASLTSKMSLRENEESPAHTVLFTIRKEDGRILSCERFHSLVKIRRKLDYDTVQAFLEHPEKLPAGWNKTFAAKIALLADLARKMRRIRREEELFLNIETKEVRALVDPEKMTVTGLRTECQREAELLVEEFMLAANSAVASEMIAKNIPGLYRVHDEPAREKIMEFTETVRFSFHLNVGDLTSREECCKFFDSLPNDQRRGIIFSSFLRSLPRAVYKSVPSLHYGLGKSEYSHFTSPIRRYTDLLIHQQLWAADGKKKLFSEEFFEEEAKRCTAKEFQVDEAYFAANDRMKLHYLLQKGVLEQGAMRTFEGIIAKVSASGLLCDIPELGIYGFVPMKYLESRMRYRAREGRYRPEKGRGGYRTGNYIYLVVDRINLVGGKAVFRPVS